MSLFGHWQPQTLSWRVAGMWERGPGSDQLTMVTRRKRTQVTKALAEFSPTLSLLENTSFLFPLELDPELQFREV